MKLTISERERGGVFALLNGEAWGGSEDALLVRDELYTTLELAVFEDRQVGLDTLRAGSRPYELSDAAARHLRDVLGKSGQPRPLARVTAPVLRRLIPLIAPQPPMPKDLDERGEVFLPAPPWQVQPLDVDKGPPE